MACPGYLHDFTINIGDFILRVHVSDSLYVVDLFASEASRLNRRDSSNIPLEALYYDALIAALKRRIDRPPAINPFSTNNFEIRASVKRLDTI